MNKNTPNPSIGERRMFPRVHASCDVSYAAVEGDPGFEDLRATQNALLKNISGGGICFVAQDPVEPGQMLALEISLPGLPSSVISYGKVCWCTQRDGADGWEVGVEFWWIGWQSEDAQEQIRGFITESLSKSDS